MTALKIGALFAGYGGLDMAVSSVLDAEPVWFSEFDKGPSKIMAHRFPGVPNHGDITKIDWSSVEPVDVLTGGSPCQDLSHAGRRAGMTEGTRSNLWVAMREAIAALRPSLVVWENVRGAYSAGADSALEHDARLLADVRRRDGEPVLRALGRVLGDLSDLGYDCRWHGLRAADVGAPHGRFRVFVVAYPQGDAGRLQHRDDAALADDCGGGREGGPQLDGDAPQGSADGDSCGGHPDRRLLPSPRTSGTNGAGQHGDGGLDLRTTVARMLPTPTTRDYKDHTIRREPHRPDDVDTLARALTDVPAALLPTPAVNDMGASYTPEEWDAWTERMKAEHGNGNGHGKSLHIEAARLLPTPNVQMANGSQTHRSGARSDELLIDGIVAAQAWGQYAAAIARWETLTRPAPAPTETGPKGNPRLSARFSEWMMGLPDGWVTNVPGITRNEALKALGNGVVPQQAAAALRLMLAHVEGVAA